jgi:GntR family transcriptional repressor for pyruvate dehydrogenase complex
MDDHVSGYTTLDRPSRLYEEIVRQIEDLIVAQKLQPGDNLPPERELAKQLGVSRAALREAIGVLSQKGLVRVVRGRGTYVAEPSLGIVSQPLSLLLRMGRTSLRELNEARLLIEVQIAALAARNAAPEDMEEIREAVEQMEREPGASEGHVVAHLAFHSALARAAHHSVFEFLLASLHDILQESTVTLASQPGGAARFQHYHREIYEAVCQGDSQAASEMMRLHLLEVDMSIREVNDTDSEGKRV